MSKRIAIFRSDSSAIDINFYNSQEIGLAKALTSQGVNVDIYMASSDGKFSSNIVHEFSGCNVVVNKLPFYRLPLIGQAIYPSLSRLMSSSDYDLLHVNEYNEVSSYLASRLAKKMDIPCLIYQGMYKVVPGRIRSFFQFFYDLVFRPFLLKNVTYPVAKTTRAKDFLYKKGFQHPIVLPVGLDLSPFSQDTTCDFNSINNITSGKKVISYIGKLEKRRNINFLIDLAHSLEFHNYVLLLVGEGELSNQVAERIKADNISNVFSIGKVEQKCLPEIYNLSNAFLLASDYEIYGMVVLEALSFGCPVFSTNTAGPEDMILNGFNGYLFSELDVNKWKSVILKTVPNYDRDKIQSDFLHRLTWDAVAKDYVNKFLS